MMDNNMKGIELQDEELDNITGGTAAVLHKDSTGHALWMDKCDKLNSADKFYKFFTGADKCGKFKRADDAISSLETCSNCSKYHHFDITKGEMDKEVINDLKTIIV